LPEVVDSQRKTRAASDFRFFCEAYFPLTFHLPWSPDRATEQVVANTKQLVDQAKQGKLVFTS
jgi:hypothetical protein